MTALDVAGLHYRLDARREALGISWREVAAQVGISASTFSRMRNGKTPSAQGLIAILGWLGDDPAAAALALKRPRSASNPDLREVLDRLVRVAESAMDTRPWSDRGECCFCLVAGDGSEHEEWCGWTTARTLAPSDLTAVRRFARALAYERRLA